jgi:hypothetical protein
MELLVTRWSKIRGRFGTISAKAKLQGPNRQKFQPTDLEAKAIASSTANKAIRH